MRIKFVRMAVQEDHGYGVIGARLYDELLAAGAEMLTRTEGGWDLKVLVGTLDSWFLDHYQPDLVFHTMWEADPLPSNWLPWINNAGAVWAPSQFVKRLLVEGGVTRPIIVSGYGVDPDDFSYIERERSNGDPYTFLVWARALVDRKQSLLAVKAFAKADLPNSRLILKHNANILGPQRSEDPLARRFRNVELTDFRGSYNGKRIENVLVITGSMAKHDLGRLFYYADCLVYPSGNEGFGLMPMEFMATGAPAIVPAYSGLADYITDDIALTLPVQDVAEDPMLERVWGRPCKTVRIAIDDIVDRMTWAYTHRDEAAALGQRAAQYIAEHWTWEAAGRRALSALEQYHAGRDGRT